MTPAEFEQSLTALSLSPDRFRAAVKLLTGVDLHRTTVRRWLAGQRKVPALAVAVVRLLKIVTDQRKRLDETPG